MNIMKDWYKYIDDKITNDFTYFNNQYEKFKNITIVCDCDGVLTEGTSVYNIEGKTNKIYGSYDKEMVDFMNSIGCNIWFVSADKNGMFITKTRISEFINKFNNVSFFEADENQRLNIVKDLKGIGQTVIFIGDSISDLLAAEEADFVCCPSNASPIYKEHDCCDYISKNEGGHGALADCLFTVYKAFKEKA